MRHAFTLVEILIVVVILGILAAVIVPALAGATDDAAEATTQSELQKIRRALDVYMARWDGSPPPIAEGGTAASWGPLVSVDYLKSPPVNPWVGAANDQVIVHGTSADSAYQTTHAWVFNPSTGEIWAGGFDASDNPLPR
ncbi:MAG: prepilin-type N-terminal cleavage/methylation domain-containing protein [Planctomycetota bacterium]